MTDYTEYKWAIYDCGRKIKCNPFCCRASTINWRLSHQRLYALMITHSGVQTHTCSECKIKKSFGEAGTLRKHMITHTGEKEHKCAECGDLFGQVGHLKRQLLTHSGEKLQTCSECNKSFGEAGTSRKHMITHTEERVHKCTECGDLFGQAAHLKMHMLTVRRSYICTHNSIMHLHEQAI